MLEYAYDPLARLVRADYSSGVHFAYAYDAGGNRTILTETTPLSGTIVTSYTFDGANRLTARAVSDGRSYTYDWSDRGELLAETTEGVDVRTFEWDAAGRLVEATVFTLTTYFTYTGDGVRVAVGVEGVGVTEYIPDRGRILEEHTATTSTRYLYGRDCLGEVRAGALLYYLADGRGYVRQATDEDGTVVDAWLFSPDGGVMAGPQGPVSHLVCGGVYDWSTGLLYQGGRYFDPTLGIWLALGPLAVIQGWQERKKRKGRGKCRLPWTVVLLVVGIGVSGMLVACKPSCPEPEHLLCLEEALYPWAPYPWQVPPLPASSEEVQIHPVHEAVVTEHGGFHWPCLFTLSCLPRKEGQIIQEIDFYASDRPNEHFWEAWPVEAGNVSPQWPWANQDCAAYQHDGCNAKFFNDFVTVGNALPPWNKSGYRRVTGFVKFYYVSPWPLPGWEKAQSMGTYRTYNPPPFWDRHGGTLHEIVINWDGTNSWGHTAYQGMCEPFRYP